MNEAIGILTRTPMLPVTLPLLAGAAAYVFSRWLRPLCKYLALVACPCVLAAGIAILTGGAEPLRWTWVSGLAPEVSLVVELAPTPLGMIVVIGAAGFALLITVYSLRAMAGHYWEGKFYAYLLWALAGACLVGLAGNLLVLLVGWEIVTLMLFLMINQGRGEAKAGAAKAFGVLGFADACLLLAIALLMGMPGGSDNLELTAPARSLAVLGATGYVVYALILIAALAKAGAVPLHTYVPAIAKDSPTPVLAYLPAALDKLLGIYLLAVLCLRMFRPDQVMQTVMMIVGAVTILAAALMAMMQHNLKELLSFCAVSQVGYMVLGLGTGTMIGVIGGLFHMVNHAIYKSGLFLMSGTAEDAAGSGELDEMGGLAKVLPVTFVCGLIAAASVSGVPPLNGFVSKLLVYEGTLQLSNNGLAMALVVAAVFGSALTLASFVKAMYSVFLAPAPKAAAPRLARARENFFLAAPMVVLAAACVFLGLFPNVLINHVLSPALEGAAMTGQAMTASVAGIDAGRIGVWSPTQAAVLIIIGLALGLVLVWLSGRGRKIRVVRPFLAGEVPAPADDRFRVPGTHLYETIGKLPVIGPLLAQGQGGAMDLYHWSGKHGHTFVEMLRAQHTGLLGLYVAWCLVGLTVSLVYLLLTRGT